MRACEMQHIVFNNCLVGGGVSKCPLLQSWIGETFTLDQVGRERKTEIKGWAQGKRHLHAPTTPGLQAPSLPDSEFPHFSTSAVWGPAGGCHLLGEKGEAGENTAT